MSSRPWPLGNPPTRPLGTCGARWNRPASPSSTFRPSPTKAQGANGATHAGPYLVPCLPPYTPPQPPELIGTLEPLESIVNRQVWLPKNMVKMGEKARGNTFPHPPRAFNLPATATHVHEPTGACRECYVSVEPDIPLKNTSVWFYAQLLCDTSMQYPHNNPAIAKYSNNPAPASRACMHPISRRASGLHALLSVLWMG